MPFDPEIAAIRFGTGLSPDLLPPVSVDQMLAGLTAPDAMAQRFPILRFSEVLPMDAELRQLVRESKKNSGGNAGEAAAGKARKLRRTARKMNANWLNMNIARGVFTETGFRERLTRFWADHFTVVGKFGILRNVASTFVEEAIRPNIAGRFGDMLTAVTKSPMMLVYLDQYVSAGSKSMLARKRGWGLNENLARELLELHTLGVGSAYTQDDVRQLAELLAGLTYRPGEGFLYRVEQGQPGDKHVLGKSYGGKWPKLADIESFLQDLAVHPDTARHLARKLVVHFVSDDPDAALVEQVAAAYAESGGDLIATYRALLDHPVAWASPDLKIKQPFDFIVSSARALGPDPRLFETLNERNTRLFIATPLLVMGQEWERPGGPDGWPEEPAAWINPQGLAGRLQWAMTVPGMIRPDLPDPRGFIEVAIGTRVDPELQFAASGAATKWEGVGLVLASPSFQRR